MIRPTSSLALLLASLWCSAASADSVPPRAPAAPALYAVTTRAGSFSFVELFQASIDGPSALAAVNAASEPPTPSPVPGARIEVPAAARTGSPETRAVSAGAMPPPAPWLMLLSGLAIACFIARRRSDAVGS
jgi:MYXO-CTERM domain-containing protein